MDDETRATDSPAIPTAPAAPPTTPGAMTVRQRTAWPIVLGVLGIAWAALSVLSGLFTIVMGIVFGALDQTDVDLSDEFTIQNLAYSIVDIPLSVYLLIGAIGLIKRRAISRKRLIRWAWLSVVAFVLFGLLPIAYGLSTDIESLTGVEAATIVVTVFTAALFALFLPVFVLWWMRRSKVREECATWS